MLNRAIFCSLLLLTLALPVGLGAQVKYEREYRIKEGEVPAPALRFVRSFPNDGKIKWYGEERFEGRAVEAKFKYRGRRHSVEFDTLGRLEDIEVEVSPESLPAPARTAIRDDLAATYEKHRIRKVQIQYRGDIPDLHSFMTTLEPDRAYELRYELVVKGRQEKVWQLYEVLYDRRGGVLHRSRIVLRNTDNIEF